MASIDDVVSNIKGGVTTLGQINQTLKAVFPQTTGTASSATGGAATLPGNPVGFMDVTLLDGTPVKIPYYNP